MTPPSTTPAPPSQNRPRESIGSPRLATPSIALIAAVASNGIIGVDNRLPWRLADDLKRFRTLTIGHAVVMGRKTWESLPRALPQRQNIVVTRQRGYVATGAEVAGSFDDALALVRLPEPVFCIGGGELFRDALGRAQRLYLTEIDRDFAGDAKFPPRRNGDWKEVARESRRSEEPGAFDYAYVTYERAAPDN
jgi:dihydrofolate reductase